MINLQIFAELAPIQNVFADFFDINTLPFYCLGFFTFFLRLIIDLIRRYYLKRNKKSENCKSVGWYIQDFLYTVISMLIGVSLCYVFESSKSISWLIVIGCGLFGSMILRAFYNQGEQSVTKITEKVSDTVVNSVCKKIDKKISGSESSEEQNDKIKNNP